MRAKSHTTSTTYKQIISNETEQKHKKDCHGEIVRDREERKSRVHNVTSKKANDSTRSDQTRSRQRPMSLLVLILALPRRDEEGGNDNLSKVAQDTGKRHQALVSDPADCRAWKSDFDADFGARWPKESIRRKGVTAFCIFDSECWVLGSKLVWRTRSVEQLIVDR